MGRWDGAEMSEICGIYLLDRLSNKDGPFERWSVGLYRDDGLGVAMGTNQTRDKTRKKIEAIFKKDILKITTEINIQFFEKSIYFSRKLTQKHQKSGHFRCFAPPVFPLPPQFFTLTGSGEGSVDNCPPCNELSFADF